MKLAIVGIGCRYPGASSATELFENILAGRRYFRPMPKERWPVEDYFHEDRQHPDTTYSKQAALLDGFEFNPAAFKIPQRTYEAMDQAHWLALQTAHEALEDARLKDLPRDTTAVILGNTLAGETSRAQILRFRWPYVQRVFDELLEGLNITGHLKTRILSRVEERFKSPFAEITEDSLAGGLANTIAGRIANHFNLRGGGYTVDGACSSSLLSVIHAAQGLETGEFDVALAGGVDISLDPFELVGFAKVGALSDGEMRVYDQRSRGFLPGEGCGIVVMKRLEDALRDGDRIYTAITGWGISSDGKGGLTAPSTSGQALAMKRAYAKAGYTMADVTLIEGHGTGTPVGDEVELSAVAECRRSFGVNGHVCGIGSIKSNIGHTKAAAGVAGLIKLVLSSYYRILPPTQGLTRPHKVFAANPHMYPVRRGGTWEAPGGPLRGAVSSAGFGGINTHVTIERPAVVPENPQGRERFVELLASGQDSEVFFIDGKDGEELARKLSVVASAAGRISLAEMSDLSAVCAAQAGNGAARLAVVAESATALAERMAKAQWILEQVRGGKEVVYCSPDDGVYLRTRPSVPRIVFLFPGQGSQRLSMGSLWRSRLPLVRALWEEFDRAVSGELPHPLSSYIFKNLDPAPESRIQDWTRDLTETAVAQPAIVASSMAMAELLRYLGVEADICLGHSLGEYTALWYAEAVSADEALRLVALRGRAMSAAGDQAGAMLSVADTPERVAELLREVVGYAEIANYNAPRSTVVSGDREAIEALHQLCTVRSIRSTRLPVSNAFHSKMMAAASEGMREPLAGARFQRLRHQVVSSVTGDFLQPDEDLRNLLGRQILGPVRYLQAIEACMSQAVDLFVEVGPSSVLSRLTRSIVGELGGIVLATDPDNEIESTSGVNHLLAYCFASGVNVRTDRLFEGRFVRQLRLPYAPRFIESPCERPVEPMRMDGEPERLVRTGMSLLSEAFAVNPAAQAEMMAPPPPSRPAAPAPAPARASQTEIFGLIQDYVVSEFGYPRDMVVPEARMGEDLNLDSIKSVEVVATAMGRLGLRHEPSGLTGLKLGDLAQRLQEMSQSGTQEEGAATPAAPAPSEPEVIPAWVRAFDKRLHPEPLGAATLEWPEGPVLLAAPETTPLVQSLKRLLEAEGRKVVTKAGKAGAGEAPFAGCLVVAPEGFRFDLREEETAVRDVRLFGPFRSLFTATSRFLRTLDGTSVAGRFLGLVVPATGIFEGEVPAHSDVLAGAGFVKSVALEHPGLETRVVAFDPVLGVDEGAKRVLAELRSGSGHVEAEHGRDGRRVPLLHPISPLDFPELPLELGPDDTIVVTGGGKGITAELAFALARAKGVRVALAGRSPVPAKGEKGEVAEVLDRFDRLGVRARYFSCDVTDAESVSRMVEDATRELGPITAVLHGAGVNKPHRVNGGEIDDFLRVLQPKMAGMLNLLQCLDLGRLRCFLVLSSIIGDSGMAGNADYAFANEWMNLVAARMRSMYPATRWLCYDYSVWAEVGMGARLGSVEALKKWGIDAIAPYEGTRLFVELLDRQWPRTNLVVASRLGRLNTLRFCQPEPDPHRFAAGAVAYQPGIELVTETLLQPSVDRFLPEHNYQGSMLFPAVVGMEAMAEVARACLRVDGREIEGRPTIENAQFGRPVVVPQQGRRIRIYALAGETEPGGLRRVHVSVRSEVTHFEVDHFRCEMVWGREAGLGAGEPVAWPEALPADPAEELYGTIFFQGPMFQNIVSYHSLSSVHCQVQIRVPGDGMSGLNGMVLDSPRVRDAFLHAIQLCVPEHRILPVSIDRLATRGFQVPMVYLSARERFRDDREFLYDLEITDAEGNLLERMDGLRCRIVEKYENESVLKTIFRLHELSAAREGKVGQPA